MTWRVWIVSASGSEDEFSDGIQSPRYSHVTSESSTRKPLYNWTGSSSSSRPEHVHQQIITHAHYLQTITRQFQNICSVTSPHLTSANGEWRLSIYTSRSLYAYSMHRWRVWCDSGALVVVLLRLWFTVGCNHYGSRDLMSRSVLLHANRIYIFCVYVGKCYTLANSVNRPYMARFQVPLNYLLTCWRALASLSKQSYVHAVQQRSPQCKAIGKQYTRLQNSLHRIYILFPALADDWIYNK